MALGDYFQSSPNFVNPDYATPGQIDQARKYAEFLMTPGKGQIPVKSWQAGLANALNQGMAGWELGQASRYDRSNYQKALDAQTKLIASQLMQGQGGNTAPVGAVSSAPLPPVASNEPAPQPTPMPAPRPASATPQPATPNARVADAFAPIDDAVRNGTIDLQGAANMTGPAGTSPAPQSYKVASLGPTPPPSQAPVAPQAAATAAPAGFPSAGAAPIRYAQSGGPSPSDLATVLMSPWASKEAKDYAGALIQPKGVEDVYGRPGISTVTNGVRAQPVGPGFQPGVRTPMSIGPEGISGTTFNTPPGSPQAAPQSTVPGGGNLGGAVNTINQLSLNNTRNKAGNAITAQDVAAANDAPAIKRVAGVMLDDLHAHGDKMTFGPTAQASNEVRRFAANYAPGLMKDQLESLASADSFDKMSAQLTGMLTKSSGTDAQLFNNMKSVPGAHNSKEGAEALLKMVMQVADQQQELQRFTSSARDAREYQALRDQFFKQNPIINPLTGHPISQDVEAQRTTENGSGWKDLGNGVRIREK